MPRGRGSGGVLLYRRGGAFGEAEGVGDQHLGTCGFADVVLDAGHVAVEDRERVGGGVGGGAKRQGEDGKGVGSGRVGLLVGSRGGGMGGRGVVNEGFAENLVSMDNLEIRGCVVYALQGCVRGAGVPGG